MSYQVLARKWRPKTFDTMMGQEHVLRVLQNALDKNRLHHAYLFAGTRGVGKTTLARIFAKALNCEKGISAKPCEVCDACKAIDAGKFLDLYEIDAASRTKVEDMRELLENVAYPPVQGRYKVYLIDEVHMLSGHSFNALLKTLEEPPPQVLFIFATTEPKKLPITILSRCLQFHLKEISIDQITSYLKRVCESEGLAYEEAAFKLLAIAANGSLRDALSLLDQAIVFCNEKLNFSEVQSMLGFIDQQDILHLFKALSSGEGGQLLEAMKSLHQRAPDYSQVLNEFISMLHQAALKKSIPAYEVSLEMSEIAGLLEAEDIQLYYQIALMGKKDLPFAPTPAQGFEMIMLRMLAFQPAVAHLEVLGGVTASILVKTLPPAPLPHAGVGTLESSWSDLIPKLELTGLAQALALNCDLVTLADTKIELIVSESHKAMVSEKLIKRIELAINQYFKKPLELVIKSTDKIVYSPVMQQLEAEAKRKAQVLENLENDPNLQKIKTIFNASVDPKSID